MFFNIVNKFVSNIFVLYLTLYSYKLIDGDYYRFIPKHIITIYPNESIKYPSICWNNVDINMNTTHINIKRNEKKSIFCNELIMWGSPSFVKTENWFFDTDMTVELKNKKIASSYGVNFFQFPNGISGLIADLSKTVTLFQGNNIEAENINFIKTKMNISMDLINAHPIPNISDIKIGDTLLIRKLDGLDPLIMWGTGAHAGHYAMFLNFSDGMYILESTDKNPYGKKFWPPPYGFIKTPYKKWFELAKNSNYQIRILRLKESNRKKLISNLNDVYQWWNKYEGTTYGYYNLLWGWIDTLDNNFPEPLTKEFLTLVISFMERNNIYANTVKSVFLDSINKKIELITNKSSNRTLLEIINWGIDNNLKIWDIWIKSEKDNWLYNNAPSRVCDTLILSFFKLGKIIPNYVQISEFTPKDLYELNIWDNYHTIQIMGKYNISIPQWNTINFYKNINEKCPSKPPKYDRPKYC